MNSTEILRIIAKASKKGYSELNKDNINPYVQSTAEDVAVDHPDLTPDHFVIALNTDGFQDYISERSEDELESTVEQLAIGLARVTPPTQGENYRRAAKDFIEQLDRKFANNQDFAHQIQIRYSQEINNKIEQLKEEQYVQKGSSESDYDIDTPIKSEDVRDSESNLLNNRPAEKIENSEFFTSQSDPDTSFSELGGYDPAVEYIKRQIIDPINNVSNPRIDPDNSILFYGYAGTGSRYFAQTTIGALGIPSAYIGPTGSFSSQEVIQMIDILFEEARKFAPCAIYFHEIDNIVGPNAFHRGNKTRPVDKFASEITNPRNKEVIMLASAYRKSMTDVPIEIKSPFTLLHIHEPDEGDRVDILETHLQSFETEDLELDNIARKSSGFTAFDLKQLVYRAAQLARSEHNSSEHSIIKQSHLKKALLKQNQLTEQIKEKTDHEIFGYNKENE